MSRSIFCIIAFFCALGCHAATAGVYSDDEVVGTIKSYRVHGDESLIEIARRFDLGYNEIAQANPALDPFVPGNDAQVVIPQGWVVPAALKTSEMVVNLSEMRVYRTFPAGGGKLLSTFPIGIGSEGSETPLGTFGILQKITAPSWHVPLSIRQEKPELPAVVPPGPDNPLGSHALRISPDGVMIHGTNKPWGVGREVSHGCIRLYPEDIPRLFGQVRVGTKVAIVREPIKVGVKGERVYIEVHADSRWHGSSFEELLRLLRGRKLVQRVDMAKCRQALREKKGVMVDVTKANSVTSASGKRS
ncbi:MAG TPA: L,D-transpeptidase family protein [Geobacteraceae bacterium]